MPMLTEGQITEHIAGLNAGWECDGVSIRRRFEFKGFAKPVYTANLAAFLGDKAGHHPDVSFGWGYCEVVLATHDVGGLTSADFDLARRLDQMMAEA